MLGFFSGVVLALWYRKEGPQQPVYEWMRGGRGRSEKIGEKGEIKIGR